MYHGEKIGEGNFESYGHYTQVCVFFDPPSNEIAKSSAGLGVR